MRRKVWLLTSGALKEINNNPNYYSSLCELTKKIPLIYEKQIEVDLERTDVSEGTTTEKIGSDVIPHLRQILQCYSVRSSSIGYCQGFNYIAAKIYKVTQDEEETFWILTKVLEEILPINYYSDIIGLIADSIVIYSSVQSIFPELSEHFKDNEFGTLVNNFLNRWLIGLFTQNLNEEVLNLVWDMFLLDGNVILVQVSLILFAILENQLLSNKNTLKGVQSILSDQFRTVTSKNLLKSYFKNQIFLLDPNQLTIMQSKFAKDYVEKHKKNDPSIIKIPIYYTKKYDKCDKKYPYCINQENIEVKKEGVDFLVFSTQKSTVVKPEYFFNEVKNRRIDMVQEDKDCFDILVERRPHTCENSERGNRGRIEEKEEKKVPRNTVNLTQLTEIAKDQNSYMKQNIPQPFFDAHSSSKYFDNVI